MSVQEDGGPAFPTSDPNYEQRYAGEGMTLRDYFAAECLPLAHLDAVSAYGPNPPRSIVAEFAYVSADAMLKARAA